MKLPRVPAKIPSSGYPQKAKEYMKCDNKSCYVTTDGAELFIFKLGNSTGPLQIGDKVLLSTHASSARSGEWILCDLNNNCFSSRTCLNSLHNSSSGKVNFAFSRSDCEKHILTVSSKSESGGALVDNNSKILLEYSSDDRSQPEWIQCEEGGSCKRHVCKRSHFTILDLNTNCKQKMRGFEILFVS